jgi:hypothetical protein
MLRPTELNSALKTDIGGLDREHLPYTPAASIFVTAETAVKGFIPVVTVYYLRVSLSGPLSSNGRLL